MITKMEPDTWDYSWVLTCLVNNALIAIPNKNLINNIGFTGSNHTKGEKKYSNYEQYRYK